MATNLQGEERLLAGHLLRRISFGPTRQEIADVLRVGRSAYVEEQLFPSRIDDSAVAQLYLQPFDPRDGASYPLRWYRRMLYSKRQLLERTTLFWHKHFATSALVTGGDRIMAEQEEALRRDAFGPFRQLVVDVTRSRAMLMFLNNDKNDGNARDAEGNRIPPNENYARELLQLFTIGPTRLNLDGTPVLDGEGRPVPNYTETDVRELARALTGWSVGKHSDIFATRKSKFVPKLHDAGDKVVLGETIRGRVGKDGAREVEDVADVIMRHPSVAPFIARSLILDFATERPTPGYVARVATAFNESGGDVRTTLRAVLVDEEFTSPAVVRTQYKTPIEHITGVFRMLDIRVETGPNIWRWAQRAGQEIYYPPSVFSYYTPGDKASLVNTYYALVRDTISANLIYDVDGFNAVTFDAGAFIERHDLRNARGAVDALADTLLYAPLDETVQAEVLDYMLGDLSEEKVRGAAWLILCSPDFQLN